jgi:signal transduction histidine kinase
MFLSPAKFIDFVDRRRRWILLAVLACLHLALLQGIFTGVGRMLLLGHLGLFILWQPFVRAEHRLNGLQLAAIVAVVLGAAAWLNWWLLVMWVMVLAGIVGGKVFFFGARWTKVYYLLVLTYLLLILLVLLMPQVIPRASVVPEAFTFLARYLLPLVFLAMAALPAEPEAERGAEVVDFVYSMFVFLLIAVLVLGSVAFMLLTGVAYADSLVYTIAAVAAVLLLLGWAWNPHAGFSGFGILFSHYLLSIGMPLEQWLHDLADHFQREDDPEAFLAGAATGLLRLPWVAGGEWYADGKQGGFGIKEGRRSEFAQASTRIAIYSRRELSPALVWHFNLLVQLIDEFYQAKQRGQQLQRLSYVKAIHETGARLTHDVKNLLQSLNMLCFAAAQEGQENTAEFRALLRRQLPVISQRLQQALDKLRKPEAENAQFVSLAEWWNSLRARYTGQGIDFYPAAATAAATLVPGALFNSVAENLLQNCLHKKHEHPDLEISVTLVEDEPPGFRVCDDGSEIPANIAGKLFLTPVASASGLGIGLYQAARHADHYGYGLRITENRPGKVCFELRGGRPRETAAD